MLRYAKFIWLSVCARTFLGLAALFQDLGATFAVARNRLGDDIDSEYYAKKPGPDSLSLGKEMN